MPGDYSRNSDQPHKRFSALFMQQGRVQLDADWNESVEILRRRIRTEASDVFGPAAVPRATTPNGFALTWTGSGATADITVSPGRIYVDGVLAECFADETVSYGKQPFFPNPPALSKMTGNVLVYLDVWEREVTALEDGSIVDPALNGVDTGTRLQTVWQVKVVGAPGGGAASCVSDFSSLFPPSGGRLTTTTVSPTLAPDPCQLAASGGYQGVDNRLYRVEVHDPANLLIKWSRDNGSVATRVTALNNSASSATITVVSVGRDDDLSFQVGSWLEVTDDLHELDGQPGLMAKVTVVNAATRTLTLDRSLASGNFDPTGAAGNVRVRRWDQTQNLYSPGGTVSGLVQATLGTPFILENGVQVQLDVVKGGTLLLGDAWVFAARVSTGLLDSLTSAPPIAIRHHYASLGTFSGLGGTTTPAPGDCRVLWPPAGTGEDCACTVCVDAADHNAGKATIQQAIDQVIKAGGGVVCLGPGTFDLGATANVSGAVGVTIHGAGKATLLSSTATTVIAVSGSSNVTLSDMRIAAAPKEGANFVVGVAVSRGLYVTIERVGFVIKAVANNDASVGAAVALSGIAGFVQIRDNVVAAGFGVVVLGGTTDAKTFAFSNAASIGRGIVAATEVRGNAFDTTLAGVYMGGQVVVDDVTLADNVFVSQYAGVYVSATAVSPLQITDNFMQVVNTGVYVACDDCRVQDNVIVGQPPSGGTGTYAGVTVASAPSGGLARADIERNRITGFVGGVGISVTGDTSRVTMRGNTIDGVDGGITMASTATAEDLVIEDNEISDVGAVSTTTKLPYGFGGIAVVGAVRAVVRRNTLQNVGTANTAGIFTFGIGVAQPTIATIADNELRGIGGLSSTATTYGIRVTAPFADLRIAANRVQATPPAATATSALVFSGIAIQNYYRRYLPGPRVLLNAEVMQAVANPTAPSAPANAPAQPAAQAPAATQVSGPVLVQLTSATDATAAASSVAARKALVSYVGDASLTKTPDAFLLASADPQSAEVAGNAVDVVPSVMALVLADVVGACVLRGNRVSLPSAASAGTSTQLPTGMPAAATVTAAATVLVASDNYVNAYTGVVGLNLFATKATVLGNISTSGINLEGNTLGSPWNALNGVS